MSIIGKKSHIYFLYLCKDFSIIVLILVKYTNVHIYQVIFAKLQGAKKRGSILIISILQKNSMQPKPKHLLIYWKILKQSYATKRYVREKTSSVSTSVLKTNCLSSPKFLIRINFSLILIGFHIPGLKII